MNYKLSAPPTNLHCKVMVKCYVLLQEGDTPLHLASEEGHVIAIEVLLHYKK